MLLIFKAIVIAIIEGLTEFIPVSSTGHMVLVGHSINFTGDFAKLFEIVIQLGAILAVIVLYWNKLIDSVKGIFKPGRPGLKFWINIVIAAIPAAILGFLFEDIIDKKLMNPTTVAAALVVGGVLMIVIENKFRRKRGKTKNVDDMTIRQSFVVGAYQCLALWPGMSRSASTIMGGWISGLSTVVAAEFSFFLAIPMMFGASGLKLFKSGFNMTTTEIIALTIGFIVAFIVSLVVIEKFIKFLQRKPMRIFAIYRILIGGIILGLALVGIL